MELNKDYNSLYRKYKKKYLIAKKNLKAGSGLPNVSGLTIDTNLKDSGERPMTPLTRSPEPRTPEKKYLFESLEPIYRLRGNRFTVEAESLEFVFEEINQIVIDGRFLTIFRSNQKGKIMYYFIKNFIPSSIKTKLEPLTIIEEKPRVLWTKPIAGPGKLDFDGKHIKFLSRHQIKFNGKEIYLFVTENEDLVYTDKIPDFIEDADYADEIRRRRFGFYDLPV